MKETKKESSNNCTQYEETEKMIRMTVINLRG